MMQIEGTHHEITLFKCKHEGCLTHHRDETSKTSDGYLIGISLF
jgi:hypothetical protein